MPNICIITSNIPPDYSGAGKRALRHAYNLEKKEYLHSLVTVTLLPFYEEEFYKVSKDKIHRIKIPKTGDSLMRAFSLVYYYSQLFIYLFKHRNDIDIIHSFSGPKHDLITILCMKMFGIKGIKEFTLMPDFSKKSSHWSQKFFLMLNLKNFDLIVCISDALENWCKEHQINTKTAVIPNDIDYFERTERSKHPRKQIEKGQFNLLFLGPKTVRKGFDIVIDAFDELRGKYKNCTLTLLGESRSIVTINEKEYNLQAHIEEGVVIDHGVVNDPYPYYEQADITLFPSRREGFGNVIIESMACGTPVIARRISLITDTIIDNKKNGILVETDASFEEYVKEIETLIKNNNFYKFLSNESIKRAKDFSTSVILEKYLNIYKQILN